MAQACRISLGQIDNGPLSPAGPHEARHQDPRRACITGGDGSVAPNL